MEYTSVIWRDFSSDSLKQIQYIQNIDVCSWKGINLCEVAPNQNKMLLVLLMVEKGAHQTSLAPNQIIKKINCESANLLITVNFDILFWLRAQFDERP